LSFRLKEQVSFSTRWRRIDDMPPGPAPASAAYCAGGMPRPYSEIGRSANQRTKRFSNNGASTWSK